MRLERRSRRRSSRGHVRKGQTPAWPRWLVGAGAALVLIIVTILIVRRLVWPTLKSDDQSSENRTWLEFAWTTEPVNQDAVRQLGQRLKSNQIDRVYLEASAWMGDGSLVEGQYTAEFAQALRTAYPEIEIVLWLRMSGEQIAQADLHDPVTQLASRAVGVWRLDGVQLNGSAVFNGSESYIQLVRNLRETIGSDAILSVTVPPDRIPTDPDVPIGSTADPGLTWNDSYKQRVGLLAIDEIVVMAHASGLLDATEYTTWVAYQVTSYVAAVAALERPPEIVIALPTYDTAPGHDPAVESVRAAIEGVREGIQNAGKSNQQLIRGVGLYEYKTTDSLEWAIYSQYWLGNKAE